jgi:hypothetical protein
MILFHNLGADTEFITVPISWIGGYYFEVIHCDSCFNDTRHIFILKLGSFCSQSTIAIVSY